ncbi:MAG: hypothetical protein KGH50_02710 [Candidatus Micrarchaeota archaeon]|nr:hypothetical protein [Candidatus Micrarchaeota archaeon]
MARTITQEDASGCGIACVAFVCRTSYGFAKRRYFKGLGSPARGYFCRDLVKALGRAGKRYGYRHIKGRERLKPGTIIFIKRSERYPAGHYLVKTGNGYMNPWINFPDIRNPKSAFARRLPGIPSYAVYPVNRPGLSYKSQQK